MKTPTHHIVTCLLSVALTALLATSSIAAAVNRATVSKTKNDVRLLSPDGTSEMAKVGDVIAGGVAVQTGSGSATQLKPPKGVTIRLGSNSWFSFSEGDINLDRGTLLVQRQGGFFSKTNIKTPTVSAAISGTTIMIEFIPPVLDAAGNVIKPGIIKIIVIEGTLEFALNINLGKKMKLRTGEMVVMSTEAKQLPQKFVIDLDRLTKTSKLLRGFEPLPDQAQITRAVAAQRRGKNGASLVAVKTAEPGFYGQGILDATNDVNARPPEPPPVIQMIVQPIDDTPSPPPILDCTNISGPPPPGCENQAGRAPVIGNRVRARRK